MLDYDDYYDYDDYDERMEARAEARSRSYRYNCGGFASYDGPCGAPDCGSCRNGAPPWEEDEDGEEDETCFSSYHIASRDYPEARIAKGDLYLRTSGFTYVKGGARTRYARKKKTLMVKAPGTEGHSERDWSRFMTKREAQNQRRRARR